MNENQAISIVYTNYRGETSIRRIIPLEIRFLSTEWHPQEQWCLIAHDLDKNAERTFACKDIKAWLVEGPQK